MANTPTARSRSKPSQVFDPTPGLNTIQTTLDKFLTAANVEAVYGAPVSQGENVVIPTAEVVSFVGFGLGLGGGSQSAEANSAGSGGGGGGGGRVLARPVAAIIMSSDGVRVEPIVDVTKIALAVFTTVGFMATVLTRMTKSRPPKI